MGYLTIKDFKKENIILHNTKQYYSIGYEKEHIRLSSVSLRLYDIQIEFENGYYIYINDKESIQTILELDTYLSYKIDNYKNILHREIDKYYIYLKQNDFLDVFMNTFNNTFLTINIVKLKKTASHTFPIVYVL